ESPALALAGPKTPAKNASVANAKRPRRWRSSWPGADAQWRRRRLLPDEGEVAAVDLLEPGFLPLAGNFLDDRGVESAGGRFAAGGNPVELRGHRLDQLLAVHGPPCLTEYPNGGIDGAKLASLFWSVGLNGAGGLGLACLGRPFLRWLVRPRFLRWHGRSPVLLVWTSGSADVAPPNQGRTVTGPAAKHPGNCGRNSAVSESFVESKVRLGRTIEIACTSSIRRG